MEVELTGTRYWFQSLYNALLYGFTPEAFPAPFRGSASGMLSTLGRIAGIVSPHDCPRDTLGGFKGCPDPTAGRTHRHDPRVQWIRFSGCTVARSGRSMGVSHCDW